MQDQADMVTPYYEGPAKDSSSMQDQAEMVTNSSDVEDEDLEEEPIESPIENAPLDTKKSKNTFSF